MPYVNENRTLGLCSSLPVVIGNWDGVLKYGYAITRELKLQSGIRLHYLEVSATDS